MCYIYKRVNHTLNSNSDRYQYHYMCSICKRFKQVYIKDHNFKKLISIQLMCHTDLVN